MVHVGKYASPMDPMGDDGRKADIGKFELKFLDLCFLRCVVCSGPFMELMTMWAFRGCLSWVETASTNVQNDPTGNHTKYSERDTQYG